LTPTHGEGKREALAVIERCRKAGALVVRTWRIHGLGSADTPTLATWRAKYDLAQCLSIAEPWRRDAPPEDDDDVQAESVFQSLSDNAIGLIRGSAVKMESIVWLWLYRFARGEMALLAGDAGLGKSSVLLWIAAAVTRGLQFPDRSGHAPVGDVIIVSAEDSRETTLVPRLVAMGADLRRVVFVTASLTIEKPGHAKTVSPMSLADRAYWGEILRRVPECRLMIIDPLPSYLGRGVNDSKNSEIRGVIEPFLEQVTRPRGICLIGNTHLNKSVDINTPLHRISGSHAYGALPRNVHLVVRDPDNPNRRFFTQVKCNNAPDNLPSLAFEMIQTLIPGPEGDIETAFPVWDRDPVDLDVRAAMSPPESRRESGPSGRSQQIADWLIGYLREAGRPVQLRDIMSAAGGLNYIGERKRDPEGRWKWSAPAILYRALELFPRGGWAIEKSQDGPRTFWCAVQTDLL
jgi:hypothetical protein